MHACRRHPAVVSFRSWRRLSVARQGERAVCASPSPSETPPPEASGSSREALSRALRRLPPGAVVIACVVAGSAALLVSVISLIAMLVTSGDVKADITSLRAELAGRAGDSDGAPAHAPEAGGLIARVNALSEKVSGLEAALVATHAKRIEELERELAATKAKVPGGKPLKPDPEFPPLLEAMDAFVQLQSMPDSTRKSLRAYRKSYESKTRSNVAYYAEKCRKMARDFESSQRDAERDIESRRVQVRDALCRSMERVIEQMLSRAREYERRKSWEQAIVAYRDLAGLKNPHFAKVAGGCRKKLAEVEAKMKEDERKRGERERARAEKAAKERKKRQKVVPRTEGGANPGAEIF